jgi:hypothetical protein
MFSDGKLTLNKKKIILQLGKEEKVQIFSSFRSMPN